MSLLKVVEVEESEGKVKDIYEEITGAAGMVPNIFKFLSISPQMLEAQWDSVKYIGAMDEDSRNLHILLRYLMSEVNGCIYCSQLLTMRLINKFNMSLEELESIKKDPLSASLNEKNKALLVFTLDALNNPDDANGDDIKKLEELGLSQLEIFDAVKTASHMYMINILSRTFKVEKDS